MTEIFRTEAKYDGSIISIVAYQDHEDFSKKYTVMQEDHFDDCVGESPLAFFDKKDEALEYAKNFVVEVKAL